MLIQDGCMDNIKSFWVKSGGNPAQIYYPDKQAGPGPPRGDHICASQIKKAPAAGGKIGKITTGKTPDHISQKRKTYDKTNWRRDIQH